MLTSATEQSDSKETQIVTFREGEPLRVRLAHHLAHHIAVLTACAMFAVLLVVYASFRNGVFSLYELNTDAATTVPLLLAATGQTIVLLRGGIDLSIGGMISLATVLAATRFDDGGWGMVYWIVIILAVGVVAGALNGVLISFLRLQPFLVTLATWSVLSGIALIILPTDGGHIPNIWTAAGNLSVIGLSTPVWILLLLGLFWCWFQRTRLGLVIRATGSAEKSAFLSGVSLPAVDISTYCLCGMFAALSGLFLVTQTATGSPTVGNDYILPTVAAAVIGGVSLFGGRGSLFGTILGAIILTIIGNLVFALQVSSFWQPIASGIVLLIAVLGSSMAERSTNRGGE
jgi:ribose transport system permease protein